MTSSVRLDPRPAPLPSPSFSPAASAVEAPVSPDSVVESELLRPRFDADEQSFVRTSEMIEARATAISELAPSGTRAPVAAYLAAIDARETKSARPAGVPEDVWKHSESLHKQGLGAADVRHYLATGQLPDVVDREGRTLESGVDRFQRLERAATEQGSWTAVNSLTSLVSMSRSALAAESSAIEAKLQSMPVEATERAVLEQAAADLHNADRSMSRGIQAVYGAATGARERASKSLLRRASSLENDAARARARGDLGRAGDLESRALALRDRGARLAYAEATYRASVPKAGFDSGRATLIAAEAQIARGRAELAIFERDPRLALPELAPSSLGNGMAANGVPGAERLLGSVDRRDHAELALETERQNALASFERLHLDRGAYFDPSVARSPELILHRERHLAARVSESRAIAARLELYGKPSGADALVAAGLEGQRRAIAEELAGSAGVSLATDRALESSGERAAALRSGFEAAIDEERAAAARLEGSSAGEKRAVDAASAVFGDALKTRGEARRDRASISDARAVTENDRRLSELASARRGALEEQLAGAEIEVDRLQRRAEHARFDAELVGRATGHASPAETYAAERSVADEAAIHAADAFARAEQTMPRREVEATRAELAQARLELARYHLRAGELDAVALATPASPDRLDISRSLIDRADGARELLTPRSEARAELSAGIIDARAGLGLARADTRLADSSRELSIAEDLAGRELGAHPALQRAARERIGQAATAAIIRSELRTEDARRADPTAGAAADALYRQAKRTIGKSEELAAIDRGLAAVPEMIESGNLQLVNGQSYAEAQARTIARAEGHAAQAQVSTVISGLGYAISFGNVDMKEEMAAGAEAAADRDVEWGRTFTAREIDKTIGLSAEYERAKSEGRAFEKLGELRDRAAIARSEVPVIRALRGSVLEYGVARDQLGDPRLSVVTSRMNELMVASRAESLEETSRNMGALVVANTGLEVALGIVLTGGIGSAGALAGASNGANAARTGLQAANAVKTTTSLGRAAKAAGTATITGAGFMGASWGVRELAGANTSASRGFDAVAGFVPFSAAQKAAGIAGTGKLAAIGAAQAMTAGVVTPRLADAIGVESELGRAALGLGVNALLAGGVGYGAGRIAERKVPGPAAKSDAKGIAGGSPAEWTPDQHRANFLAGYPGAGPAASMSTKEFVRAFGKGPYTGALAALARDPAFVEFAKTDPARARILHEAMKTNLPVYGTVHGTHKGNYAAAADALGPLIPKSRSPNPDFKIVEHNPGLAEKRGAIHAQPSARLDHNGAFHEKALLGGKKEVVSDVAVRLSATADQLIGVDGTPLADLRQVAIFSAHGEPWRFSGISTKNAARMMAQEIVRANKNRPPGEPKIQYLLLDSCSQGDRRFILGGSTNAQQFQKHLDAELGKLGYSLKGTREITVLASDRPGVLYGAEHKTKDGMVPATFIPAQNQKPPVHVGAPEAVILGSTAGILGAGAYLIYEITKNEKPAP